MTLKTPWIERLALVASVCFSATTIGACGSASNGTPSNGMSASNGGTNASNGGTSSSDGGANSSNGGRGASDGGTSSSNGGRGASDGGRGASDGGTDASNGGTGGKTPARRPTGRRGDTSTRQSLDRQRLAAEDGARLLFRATA